MTESLSSTAFRKGERQMKKINYLIKIEPLLKRDFNREKELQTKILKLLNEYNNVSMVVFHRTKITTKHLKNIEVALYFPGKDTSWIINHNEMVNGD